LPWSADRRVPPREDRHTHRRESGDTPINGVPNWKMGIVDIDTSFPKSQREWPSKSMRVLIA